MGVFSNNRPSIVPGALISSSYVSDIYDVFMGQTRESVVVSGSLVISGSSIITSGVTASLFGTSSWAVTASHALNTITASFAQNSNNAITASFALRTNTIDYVVSSSVADLAQTASYYNDSHLLSSNAFNALTSSLLAASASYYNDSHLLSISSFNAITSSMSVASASISQNAITSSFSQFAVTASYALNATGGGSTINVGNILYVASTGDDSDLTRSGHIGNIGKPFLTLKAARDAAIAGDLIYVFSQTFTFDNRDSNGNYWNSRLDDLNIWKNGVNYYFESGCKIKFYNQSVTGGQMDLLRPRGIVNETCNVYGYLEFETYSVGPDTVNGSTYFFYGAPIESVDAGYTCHLQVKSLYSECMEMIYVSRGTTISGTAKVTIEADSAIKNFVTGQGGTYACIIINGIASGLLEYNANIRHMSSNLGYTYQFKGDLSNTVINGRGDVIICTDLVVFHIRPAGATDSTYIRDKAVINLDFKKIYFKGPSSNTGCVVDTHNSHTTLLVSVELLVNLKGDCIEYEATGRAKTLFNLYNLGSSSSKKVINYVGNIYTITQTGETTQALYSQGRRIAYCMGPNSFININGNINYNGTLVTLREAFRVGEGGTINFSGNMRGNFGCPITKCNTGVINISNSTIISEIDSSASSILSNGFCYINSNGGLTGNFATGKVIINNSYIKLKNSSGYIGNGGYLDAIIANSTIINSGTSGSGIINQVPYYADTATVGAPSNSTPSGKIQLINSNILVAPSGSSLNYVDTTAVAVNSSTNANYNVSTTLKGTLTILTDLSI